MYVKTWVYICVYWFIVRQDPSSLARGYDPLYSSSPLASLDGFSLFPRTATCWILTVMPLVMFFQPVDVRLSFPFVWMPWKLTRDYNMADFQAKICEKFNINSLTDNQSKSITAIIDGKYVFVGTKMGSVKRVLIVCSYH